MSASKSWIDLANADTINAMDAVMKGMVIPNDFPDAGDGLIYTSTNAATSAGFEATALTPGDQIWFYNPYFEMLTEEQQAMDKFLGEQGSNVFYIGNGNVIGLYGGDVMSISEYQTYMSTWASVTTLTTDATASDFPIMTQNSPLLNPFDF